MDPLRRRRPEPSVRRPKTPREIVEVPPAPHRPASRRHRRCLWSPPPRRKTLPIVSSVSSTRPLPKMSSLWLTMPCSPPRTPRLCSVVATPPSLRSHLDKLRSHYSSCPPLPHRSHNVEEDPGNALHLSSGTPLQRRPPLTCHGSQSCCSVAAMLIISAGRRTQPRPPTPEDVARINRRLSKLSVA